MNITHVIIHRPEKEEDARRLLREISRFRAEKAIKHLRDANFSTEQILGLVNAPPLG